MAKHSDLKRATKPLPITINTVDENGERTAYTLAARYRPHQILSDDIAGMADVESLRDESTTLDGFIAKVFVSLDLQDDEDKEYELTPDFLKTVDRNIKIQAAKEAIEDSRPKDATA